MKSDRLAVHCWILAVAGGLVACQREPAVTAPAGEVRGAPINATPSPSPSPTPTRTTADTPVAPRAAAAASASALKPVAEGAPPAYPPLGFDKLAGYPIEISDELLGPVTNNVAAITARTEALIPDPVKAFSKKRVALRGFMLPLKVEGGLVTELLIMKDQSMCCYGTVPKIHEWVSVKMTEKGIKPIMDQPVTLFGTLYVGEMRENGYLTGIYRMDGDRMDAGPD
jgi:hypothetical protein